MVHLWVRGPWYFKSPSNLFQISINKVRIWCLHLQLLNNLKSDDKHHWVMMAFQVIVQNSCKQFLLTLGLTDSSLFSIAFVTNSRPNLAASWSLTNSSSLTSERGAAYMIVLTASVIAGSQFLWTIGVQLKISRCQAWYANAQTFLQH